MASHEQPIAIYLVSLRMFADKSKLSFQQIQMNFSSMQVYNVEKSSYENCHFVER